VLQPRSAAGSPAEICDSLHLHVRSLKGNSRLQPPVNFQRVSRPLGRGIGSQRDGDLQFFGERRACRHHSDDHMIDSIQDKGLTQQFRGDAAESTPGKFRGDDRDPIASGLVFLGEKSPSHRRREAQRREKIRGHRPHVHQFGARASREIHRAAADRRERRPTLAACLPLLVVRHGGGVERHVAGEIGIVNDRQPIGFGQRKRSQDERVHDGEHRRGRADTDGHDQDRDAGKPGRLAKLAKSKAQIAQRCLQTYPPALFAGDLLDLFDTAELPPRGVARFVRRHARGEICLRPSVEMGLHLLRHVGIEIFSPEKREKRGPKAHGLRAPLRLLGGA
jgi:hypothetical protein